MCSMYDGKKAYVVSMSQSISRSSVNVSSQSGSCLSLYYMFRPPRLRICFLFFVFREHIGMVRICK